MAINQRHKFKRGFVTARPVAGEELIEVGFRATEAIAKFADVQPQGPSCNPPVPDTVKAHIRIAEHNRSVIAITWTVASVRRIEYSILG